MSLLLMFETKQGGVALENTLEL